MISLDGRGKQFLGCFVTPEEAALVLARRLASDVDLRLESRD